MKRQLLIGCGWAILAAFPAFCQQQQQGPKPKSQKEVEALQKVQTAAQSGNTDAEVDAIENVLQNFADTEFKVQLLSMATQAEQTKGDYAKTIVYGDRTIEADPNNIPVRVMLAQTVASHTRENDLDKDQSVKKVQDYANKALDLLKSNPTAPPGIPADQWPTYQKELASQAHDALAQTAEVQKNYPQAITEYKTALDLNSNPVTTARLAKAYNGAKQYDDAITTADKVLAMNNAQPVVKQFAQQQKDLATKLKTSGGK